MKKQLLRSLFGIVALGTSALAAEAADYTLPFDFPASQENFDKCEVIDVNKDGNPDDKNNRGYWIYNSPTTSFKYAASIENPADDWLITPLVDCGDATEVTVSFKFQTATDKESLEVYLGQARTVDAMTTEVVKITDVAESKGKVYEATVSLPAKGEWCIGFHAATSQAFTYYIYVSEIKMVADGGGEVKVLPMAPVVKEHTMTDLDFKAVVTMPSTLTDGTAISSPMDLKVLVDGNVAKTIEGLAAGSDTDVDLTLTAGNHTISFVAVLGDVESEGKGVTVEATEPVKIPSAPEIVTYKTEYLDFSATVKMPSTDTKGDAIGSTMTLRMYVDGAVATTKNYISAGSTVNVDYRLTAGSHEIKFVAVLDGEESAPATVNVVATEKSYELPFEFVASETTFDECVVVDANNDGSTYGSNGKWNFEKGAFVYYYNTSNKADDWIILPFVDFGSTSKVKVTVTVKTGGYKENFEVRLGQTRNVAGMTLPVMSRENYQNNTDYEELSAEVVLPAESNGNLWSLGIHATSERDMAYIYVQKITIESADAPAGTPAAPVIKTSANDGLSYSATVTMPSVSVDDAPIEGEMSLEVYVDDVLADTKTGCAAGSDVKVELNLEEGKHVIGFVAVAGELRSEAVTEEVSPKAPVISTGDLPYSFGATTQAEFDQCVVIDVKDDKTVSSGNTFGAWSYASTNDGFKYVYSSNNDADDWLILPMVDFGTSNKVKISVDVKTASDTESFEILLGRERTIEAMTLPVLSKNEFKQQNNFITLSAEVEIPAATTRSTDNSWALGVHATSPKFHYNLYVKNFRIESVSTTLSVEDVEAAEADCVKEYYNLQGMKVENPGRGIYIVREGAKTYKVVL